MEKSTLKPMSGCSINNTITKILIEEITEWILSNPNIKPLCVSSDVVNAFNP